MKDLEANGFGGREQRRNRGGLSMEKEREEGKWWWVREGSEAVSLFTVDVRLFKVRRRLSAHVGHLSVDYNVFLAPGVFHL